MNNVTVNEDNISVQVVADTVNVTISESIGIPVGGTTGQVLKKDTADDYDVSWGDGGVPYTGATQDVNLGEFGLLTGNIEFDTSPTNAPTGAGSMVWNDTEGTADLMLKGASVNLPIGQKQVIRAVNGTGGNLTRAAYRAVKITGAQGQRLQVNLARADNDANSKDTIGLVAEDISNNQEGFIVTSGTIENINTTGNLQGETWADGDTLYLSGTTSGVITNVKPSAPTHTVILGFVIYAHANNGKIYTKVDNGYELDELHNVNVSTAASGDYLRYNGTLWVDSTIQAGDLPTGIDAAKIGTGVVSNTEFGYLDGVTSAIQTQLNGKQATLTNPVTGMGVSGQVTYFSGTSAVTGSNNLFWDATNNRLGIGTTSPGVNLDVVGTGSAIVRIKGGSAANQGAAYYIREASTNNTFFAIGDSAAVIGGAVDTLSVIYTRVAPLSLYLNGADRHRFHANSNVTFGGIVDAGYRLDVQGTLRNTTDAYFATSSGDVRIGTTTGTVSTGFTFLTINGSSYGALELRNGGALRATMYHDGSNLNFSASTGGMAIGTAGAERVRITTTGNVGLGTTSPTNKLMVIAGNSSGFNLSYDTSGNNRTGIFAWTNASSGGGIGGGMEQTSDFVFTARSTSASYLSFGAGNIGFAGNTGLTAGSTFTPTTRLLIWGGTGNVSIGNTNNTYNLDVSGTLRNTTDAYFATSSGNVGIGNTSTSYKLDVTGTIRSTSTLLWGTSGGTYEYAGGATHIRGYSNSTLNLDYSGGSSGWGINNQADTSRLLSVNDIGCLGLGIATFEASVTRAVYIATGVSPAASATDGFVMYSADITAGNAAAHFRTEGGAIIKLYQQTTGVAGAALTGGGGTALTDTDTFDGYTLKQIVKALRNNGLLA